MDTRLATSLAKYMEFVGPYKSHEILLACSRDCEASLNEIREVIGDQFARVHTHILANHKNGWPIGCNMMFNAVAYHVWTTIDCKCWYFFEADNTPIKPNWINTLSDEYDRVGRPFMGVIHPSYWTHGKGTSEQRVVQDGTHLVGTSIYPKDTPRYSKLFRSIPYAQIPWDVYWQWEIIKHAASTGLIQHEWRTARYKRNKQTGEIKGERFPKDLLPYDPRPVAPDAVVLHGCKDGTLMHIMRGFFASRLVSVSGEKIESQEENDQPQLEGVNV
jgi:hypothetical protein